MPTLIALLRGINVGAASVLQWPTCGSSSRNWATRCADAPQQRHVVFKSSSSDTAKAGHGSKALLDGTSISAHVLVVTATELALPKENPLLDRDNVAAPSGLLANPAGG